MDLLFWNVVLKPYLDHTLVPTHAYAYLWDLGFIADILGKILH